MDDMTETFIKHPDYLRLRRSASIEEQIATLEAVSHGHDNPRLPKATRQVADVILGRAVRIIRTGTTDDALSATLALSRALMGDLTDRLQARDPDALKLITAAEIALSRAYSPDSEIGQVPVLRKWNGRALDIVALLTNERDKALPRTTLRKRLQIDDESHLSHILRDLEAAGLIRRSRSGKSVTVHLGPTAGEPHVQEMLRARNEDWRPVITVLEDIDTHVKARFADAPPEAREALADFREHLDGFLLGSGSGPRIERPYVTLRQWDCFRDTLIFTVQVEGRQRGGSSSGSETVGITALTVWRLKTLAGVVSAECCSPLVRQVHVPDRRPKHSDAHSGSPVGSLPEKPSIDEWDSPVRSSAATHEPPVISGYDKPSSRFLQNA